MSDVRELLTDSADRLFADLNAEITRADAESGHWPAKAWRAISEMGFCQALMPEDQGGLGSSADALALVELTGFHTLPIPLGETLVGNRLLAAANLGIDNQPLTLADPRHSPLRLAREGEHWRLHGRLTRVAFGRHAHRVLAVATTDQRPALIALQAADLPWEQDISLAGEPRDSVDLSGITLDDTRFAPFPEGELDLLHWGALLRTLLMAGALRRALSLAVRYANERQQFGRPIGKFQAIQQQLAEAAGHTAAAGAAANAAARRADNGTGTFSIAVAKARVGEAAGRVAAISHQVHGAMGYTREHPLHYSTRRLWSWRDEFGSEAFWQERLGTLALQHGRDGLWPFLTAAQGGLITTSETP